MIRNPAHKQAPAPTKEYALAEAQRLNAELLGKQLSERELRLNHLQWHYWFGVSTGNHTVVAP